MSGAGTPPILDQVFDGDSLYALRAAVAAHATQAGLPQGRAEDLVIAVHELAANAVRHGAGHGRLRVWKHHQALHCEVSDEGAPQAPGSGTGPDTGLDADAESGGAALWRSEPGHGLWMVRQLADQISLRSGPHGTTGTVSFNLGPPGPLPPLQLLQRSQRGCTVMAITGQLDLSSADQFIDAVDDLIATTPAPRLVLDLADLTFWDSSGLAALLTAQQRINARPAAQMTLAGLPGQLLQRLHDTGLTSRFTLADTADNAIREIIPPA
jgi:anti-anti-sigma factor